MINNRVFRNRKKTKLTLLFQILRLLLGVEDTADFKQSTTKAHKNEEYSQNNRFVRQCSVEMGSVPSKP